MTAQDTEYGPSQQGDEEGPGWPGRRAITDTFAHAGGLAIQRKAAGGGGGGAAEAQADAAGAAVAGGAPATDARIVADDQRPAEGQLTRKQFLELLHERVIATANDALGFLWSAVGCPYIEKWFTRNANTDAASLERMARRYGRMTAPPKSALDYIPPILDRLRDGIARWRAGEDLSGDLAAAGLSQEASAAVPGVAQTTPAGVQAKAAPDTAAAAAPGSPERILGELGEGSPLDATTASRMGGAFGTSFDDVRVHADDKGGRLAGEQGALAFAVGSHVAFAPGRYNPGSPEGDALLAHELTHVLQQRGATAEQPRKKRAEEIETGGGLEGEADQGAAAALAYLYKGARTTAARAVNAVTTGYELQRCPGEVENTGGLETVLFRADTFDGDDFETYITHETDEKWKVAKVKITLDYIGKDDSDGERPSWILDANYKQTPAPKIKFDKSDGWTSGEIDVYGDGKYIVKISRKTIRLDGWKPKSRLHIFNVKGPYDLRKEGFDRDVTIKSKDAMPASLADAKEGDGIPADSGVKVDDQAHNAMPVHMAAIAAKRWLDGMLGDAVYGLNGGVAPWADLKKKVDADHAKYAKSTTPDPAAAIRLTRVSDDLIRIKPMLLALGVGSKKEAYLPDIADDAILLIAEVRKKYEDAIAGTYDGDVDAKLKAADEAFHIVWYRVSSLYLQRGKGAEKMIWDAGWAAQEVSNVRGKGRGAVYWPALERKIGVPAAKGSGGTDMIQDAKDLWLRVRDEFMAGKTGSLSKVEKIVEDAQLVMGLSSLIVTNEVFHILKMEMDGLVGGAFDTLGRDLTKVAGGYIGKFEKIINGLEKDLKGGADINAIGKAAISEFQAIVTPKSFKDDIEAIKSRIKWIQGIEILGKVLLIIGVAALTAGAAGAAVGGALEGAGAAAGGAIVATGEFVAEVVAFTVVSRLGNQAVFGKNDTSFGEDLITNALMFGFLKAAAAGYGRVFKVFADPKLHKVAYAVGGAVTGMVALQTFAEVHHRYKTGKFMEGGDRARAVFQNAVILVALGLGSHLAKPLNARIKADVLVFTAKHFPGRMEAIGSKIAALKGEVDALRTGDPAAAEKAPELLKKIESLWNEEISVLSEAAKKEGTTEAAKKFQETVQGYVAEIARLDLQLSSAGVDISLGATKAGNYFRPISPGFVAFKPEGLEIAKEFYKEHKGTFEKIREDMYSGKMGGEEIFFVPEAKAREFLLETPDVVGLKDAEAKKPKADKDADPAKFEKDAESFAGEMGKTVGGAKGTTVKEVELASLTADLQVEVGLRVLDPLFGKNSSGAFKDAAKGIDAEADAAKKDRAQKDFEALQKERDRIMKEMLDTMRDPSLTIAKRKTQLLDLAAELEGKIKKNGKVDASKIDFAEAKKQIDSLTAETFDNMMTVDNDGNISQGGKKTGTLRDLIEKIKSINNLYRKNGVPKEFAISISTPKNPSIPKEVKVLSRTPKETAPGKPHEPVDPMDPSMEGVVVDIGVGLGDYARDVGGETGPVVKTEYGEGYADPAMIRRDLTWEHTAPRIDADSVLILGDALQTLPMLFGAKSVKRLFINNINAHYPEGGTLYRNLALGLRKIMVNGGRVEVQWTTATETTGGKTTSRGHITGEALDAALKDTAAAQPRKVDVDKSAKPITDADYSVEAPRGKSGVPSKTPPTNPVPEFRWIFTFGE